MKGASRNGLVTVLLALVLAWPVLMGAERVSCVPVPVEPDCAGQGEYVHPWDPDEPVCCAGLESATPMELDPTTGECAALVGGAVCIACGDGVCGAGENACLCPGDCATDCVPGGEYVWPWDPNGAACCAGLVATVIAEEDQATGTCEYTEGAMVCLACGDGVCDRDENRCSCPGDCAEACAGQGEYIHPWDPNGPWCCSGLDSATPTELDPTTGECLELVGGAVCIACGDGVCGAGENACLCPGDCELPG